MPPPSKKRGSKSAVVPNKRLKTARGSASQPINIESLQPALSIRTSPQKALAEAASQATDEYPFESQLHNLVPENQTCQ
jgi:hypothetical protein